MRLRARSTSCIPSPRLRTCEDINECATDNGGCGDATRFQCINGSGRAAVCGDIDECATANGGCDPLSACTNANGSYSCGSCPEGYVGTGLSGCIDIDECADSDGPATHARVYHHAVPSRSGHSGV